VRLVFFGSGAFGLSSFEALCAGGLPPVLAVTQPPRRRSRRGAEEPTPVHAAATAAGIHVLAPPKVNQPEPLARLREAAADLFVVAEYGQLLGHELLAIPPRGTINVHGSLLPRWRGATPVAAAILHGDAETGITIQRTVYELDAGPILAVRRTPIAPHEDTGELTARLAALGGELLVEVVRAMAAGDPPAERPQDPAGVTYCRRLRPEDARLDWMRDAAALERQVRALRPRPGARATLLREPPLELEVRRASVVAGSALPGAVAALGRTWFDIGTGEGLLRVEEVVPQSRRAMDAGSFVNGYRLREGERFR